MWDCPADVILMLCGWQSGKTVSGTPWMLREIQRKGPGEYGVGSRSFPLMQRKVLPEYERALRGLGKMYRGSPPYFEFSREGAWRVFGASTEECVIHFCHMDAADSLASGTWGAFHGDEMGQSAIPLASHEELNARLLVRKGRRLYTTIPYVWNWLKTHVYDLWMQGAKDIAVINFPTESNPAISSDPETLERVRRDRSRMPEWKAKARYDGVYTRPAGMIYDCFSDANTCKRFPIPLHWPRIIHGVDFGEVHMAGIWMALDPEENIWYLFRAYLPEKRLTEAEHLINWRRKGRWTEDKVPRPIDPYAVGGSWSEQEWRDKFARLGYDIHKPAFRDVELGIQAVYSLLKSGRLIVFDDLDKLLAEFNEYSYEIDDEGDPIQGKIERKEEFHRLDALRYPCTVISEPLERTVTSVPRGRPQVTEEEELERRITGEVQPIHDEGDRGAPMVGRREDRTGGSRVVRPERGIARPGGDARSRARRRSGS